MLEEKFAKKKKAEEEEKKRRGNLVYRKQVAEIEKLLTQLIVQMVDNQNADDQALIMIRYALKRLQGAIRFLR